MAGVTATKKASSPISSTSLTLSISSAGETGRRQWAITRSSSALLNGLVK